MKHSVWFNIKISFILAIIQEMINRLLFAYATEIEQIQNLIICYFLFREIK